MSDTKYFFSYSIEGLRVLLSKEATADYQLGNPIARQHIEAMAQRRANNTGEPCDVFADDEVTEVYATKPQP